MCAMKISNDTNCRWWLDRLDGGQDRSLIDSIEGEKMEKKIKKSNGPVIVEDLGKDAWMPVEKVLVENGVVIGQRFG